MTTRSVFNQPARLDVRVDQTTLDRLRLLARQRQQPVGGVLGDLTAAAVSSSPSPVPLVGQAGAGPGEAAVQVNTAASPNHRTSEVPA